jgi:hypothetical protein
MLEIKKKMHTLDHITKFLHFKVSHFMHLNRTMKYFKCQFGMSSPLIIRWAFFIS